ncbi:MAG: ParB/RepB/Spo0J family partition protein [Clostridium sp.]|nr:ParB/RepB/Spo0J family partition protein [Clostridium sp.]MCM1443797.1 ParB/RepB/Spo0J family partition protein [Candidatus Amulumruptor caecigallinarius]
METKKKALGRGLEELFNSENLDLNQIETKIYETVTNEEIFEVSLDELRPNPYQPRKTFDNEALQDLANSIKEYGVIQPIIIKKSIKGYEIVAGERRYRASKLAGLEKIPAIIRNFTDEQMMEIALLENLQRENLNSIEEAIAYKKMIEALNLTQDELAKKVGKSRSHITNILGLLRLPNEVQQMVIESKLTMGHARALSKLESDDEIIDLANKIIKEHLPVRETELNLNEGSIEKKNKINRISTKTNEYKYVEDMLREKLDTKVKIKDKKIEITFTNVADLNRILEVLNVKD